MSIERHRFKPLHRGLLTRRWMDHSRITQLLSALGMPHKRVYAGKNGNRGKFWDQPESALMDYAEDARALYLRRIKSAHPDSGGSNEQATVLTTAWERIRLLFGRHGIEL